MISVKNDFQSRVDEINKYYELLVSIIEKESLLIFPHEDNRTERFDVTITSTLKSNMYLLLYNLVESTITKCLIEMHESICNAECTYIQLSPQIQDILTSHYYKSLSRGNISESTALQHIRKMINFLAFEAKFSLTFDEFTKYKTGSKFAGNLDSREINKIAEKYGIAFNSICKEIQEIKEFRNKLAHGESSFQEASNQKDLKYFNHLKTETIAFLSDFIKAVESYIDQKEFKKTTIEA